MSDTVENVVNAAQIKETAAEKVLNVHCSKCGAPARYDILKHSYTCKFCGQDTGLETALKEKAGFRALVQERIKEEGLGFEASSAKCPTCGAEILFPQNEVIKTCPFCRRELVLEKYTEIREFPELIVPFRITEGEARDLLKKWCDENSSKKEAGQLKASIGEVQGYYLPYELVRGPIDCEASREGATRRYKCRGVLQNTFVNTSSQLDNLTLDGMEPFDLDDLTEFNFAYLARQKAKVDDVSDEALRSRVKEEVQSGYTPVVAKTLETKAITISPDTEKLMKMPVLLPVYYIKKGKLSAAVNGQTGKVAVRSQKVKKTLPWWIKPIVASVVVALLSVSVTYLLTGDWSEAFDLGGKIAFMAALVVFTVYHNAYEGTERKKLLPDIFTSRELYERDDKGKLAVSHKKIEGEILKPQFFENVGGTLCPVTIRFTCAERTLKTAVAIFIALFLPTMIAFFINGFSFQGLDILMGAGGWLVLAVPVTFAYYMKWGRAELYDYPYIYYRDERGRRRKLKEKSARAEIFGIFGIIFGFLREPSLMWAPLLMIALFIGSIFMTLN